MNATDLLVAYKKNRSEDAFAELVRRHTNLVYSIARRRLSSEPLAEEVTQTVFFRLATCDAKINGDASLVAWLHRTTVHVAVDVWRSETRRRTREEKAAAMESTPTEDVQVWEEVAPKLDEALDVLNDEDRQAVLLRFFGGKRMREIGHTFGISEDAAKMRISRALDRLRTQLGAGGVSCTAAVLAGLLTERAIQAAPSHLVPRLLALKLTAPVGLVGTGLIASKIKLGLGAPALFCAGVGLLVFLWPSGSKTLDTLPANATEAPVLAQSKLGDGPLLKRAAPLAALPDSALPTGARLALHILDTDTGEGISAARIRAVYFYSGGVGEEHEVQPDSKGTAVIPEPSKNGAGGMNIFVTAEWYVPKCLQWSEKKPASYTMKLQPAFGVGGVVIDERGQPVGGVKIEVQGHGIDGLGPDHIAFNGGNSEVASDQGGRWLCPHIPKEWITVRFILTRDDYAVTTVELPVQSADRTNATVVLKQGFIATGQVRDQNNQPIPGATVKELHNYGYRILSTATDKEGGFTLRGLWDPMEPKVTLVVEAKGYTPQTKEVQLRTPTNEIHVVLDKGRLFRGRVTDEAGNPIPNAVVRTDADNQGVVRFRWLTHTDAEGRFEWDSAPEGPVLFWFETPGYECLRDVLLEADGSEHQIKLARTAR